MMNKDSFPLGFITGAIAPFISLAVFYGLIYLVVTVFGIQPFLPLNSLVLLSIAPNFVGLRFFYNKKHLEHSGQGVLFITVAYVLLFFIFIHGRELTHLPGLQY